MTRSWSLSLVGAIAILAIASPILARPVETVSSDPEPDTPAPRFADSDTIWFGGTDTGGAAIPGGAWDFEDGTLQGWTSIDGSDIPPFVGRDTRVDFIADPVDGVISGQASVWFGAHNGQARSMCYHGGQGYGNNWIMVAEKTYTLGDVPLSPGTQFRYFADSEDSFDYTYLIVETAYGTDTLATYTGSVHEGTNHGGPTEAVGVAMPLMETGVISPGETFTVRFVFVSDAIASDEFDETVAWYGFDCINGAFGFDDIAVSNVDMGAGGSHIDVDDFLSGDEGWVFYSMPATGRYLDVAPVSSLDPSIPTGCELDDPANDYVMTMSDRSGGGPAHPTRQIETAISPAAYVGPGSGVEDAQGFFVQLDRYDDLEFAQNVGYRVGMQYYPWTCPDTGEDRWSIVHEGPAGFYTQHTACEAFRFPETTDLVLPSGLDSVRVVIELLSGCEFFGTPCSTGVESNQTPYLDNVQIGVLISVPEVLSVPGEFTTIADAIAAAADRDTIEVGPGTYTGLANVPLDFGGKDIVVRSSGGAAVTILDAEGQGPVVVFDDGEGPGARLEGFTLVNGSAPGTVSRGGLPSGGGIQCLNSSPVIRDCQVRDNVAQLVGGGIYVASGDPTFEDCVITGNFASAVGGVGIVNGTVTFDGCVVTGNAGDDLGGIGASTNATVSLVGCTVAANIATNITEGVGGLRAFQGTIDVTRSIVMDNCGPFADDGWIESNAALDIVCSNLDPTAWILDGGFTIDADSFSSDPLFCDAQLCTAAPTSEGNYGLQSGSPCLSENSPCGQLVGALGSCAVVSVTPADVRPRLALFANVPNPFNPTTRISFAIPDRGRVRLRVFDVSGQAVRTLVDGLLGDGRHHVAWDGLDDTGAAVASGIYFYQLEADGQRATRRMTLLK